MPILFNSPPGFKYMIFVNETKDRRVVFFIQGICTIEECVSFINKYPMEEINEANDHLVPITTDVFENEVYATVRGIRTSYEGQKMPDWLQYLTEKHGGTMRFTDAYTYHIEKHMVLTKTGEAERVTIFRST